MGAPPFKSKNRVVILWRTLPLSETQQPLGATAHLYGQTTSRGAKVERPLFSKVLAIAGVHWQPTHITVHP